MEAKNYRPATIVCDIDGCLLRHNGDIVYQYRQNPDVLPHVLNKIRAWDQKGYKIILLTGRKESTRKETEEQLSKAGIVYDQLVMGVGGGPRYLINDLKPWSHQRTATAFNLKRNAGLKHINIPDEHQDIKTPKRVEKPWGAEEWIEVNSHYVVKKLIMNQGHCCSLQYHEWKHETFCILSGKMKLRVGTDPDKLEEKEMLPGDTYVLPPGTIHQMEALEHSVYLECSTTELEDVVRLKDKYGRAELPSTDND